MWKLSWAWIVKKKRVAFWNVTSCTDNLGNWDKNHSFRGPILCWGMIFSPFSCKFLFVREWNSRGIYVFFFQQFLPNNLYACILFHISEIYTLNLSFLQKKRERERERKEKYVIQDKNCKSVKNKREKCLNNLFF